MIPTVILTGASGGLGLGCAHSVLGRGEAEVVLAVRDEERGETARRALDPRRCRVERLDLASLASVEEFCGRLGGRLGPDPAALVCNAGVQVTSGTRWTEDGVEMTFGVNHLGHFSLVRGLLPSLPAGSRVVVVSSDTHDPRRVNGMPPPRLEPVEALAGPAETGRDSRRRGRVRYATSKLCNVLFAYELGRWLEETRPEDRIAVLAFNPGLMAGSGLARDYGPLSRFAWRHLLPLLPISRSASESGARLAGLAVDPDFAGCGGLYFDGGRPARSSRASYDREAARELWEGSERLCAELGHPVPGRQGRARTSTNR